MSNANGKILKKMLEQSYELQADDEAKEVYIKNLQDFLCAGLATENVSCIPKLKNGKLCLEYELDTITHSCAGDLLSNALHSYEEKNRLYSLKSEVHTVAIPVNQNNSNEVHLTKPQKLLKEERVHDETTRIQEKEKKHLLGKELVEDCEKQVEKIPEEPTEEINLLPTVKKIELDHEIRQPEELVVMWSGESNLKVQGVQHDIIEMDEDFARIRIQQATMGDVIKIVFSHRITEFNYEFLEEENKTIEITDNHSLEVQSYFSTDDLEYVQYDISVEDIHTQKVESNQLVILPLEKTKGPCKAMVVVKGENGENSIYTSPSGKETVIDEIKVGSHLFQIEAFFKRGEFNVDIYGRGDTNNQNRYDISLEEFKRTSKRELEIGHPVLEVEQDGVSAKVHLIPLVEKWSEEQNLDVACAIIISDQDGDEQIYKCLSEMSDEERSNALSLNINRVAYFPLGNEEKVVYAIGNTQGLTAVVE